MVYFVLNPENKQVKILKIFQQDREDHRVREIEGYYGSGAAVRGKKSENDNARFFEINKYL